MPVGQVRDFKACGGKKPIRPAATFSHWEKDKLLSRGLQIIVVAAQAAIHGNIQSMLVSF